MKLSDPSPATVPTDPTVPIDPESSGRTGAERREAATSVPVGSVGTVGSVLTDRPTVPKSILDRFRPSLPNVEASPALPPITPSPITAEPIADVPPGWEIIEVDPDEVPDCSCGRTMASQSLDGRWRCSVCDADYHDRRRRTEAFIRELQRIREKHDPARGP